MDAKVVEQRAIGLLVASPADRGVLASFLGELGHAVVAPASGAGGLPEGLAGCSLVIVDEYAAREHADAILELKNRARPLLLPLLLALPARAQAAPWLRRGFDEVLRMPVARSDLLGRIETSLRLRRHSEEALSASEAFSRATLDAIDSNICVVDAEGRITLVNLAWRKFAEVNGGQLSATCEGSDYRAACRAVAAHPDPEVRGAAAQILAVLEGRAPSSVAEYPCHGPGERRWFLVSATRFGEAGAGFTVVTHTNVTARRESERAALAAEQRFRSLVELSSDYFWETDAEHRFIARPSDADHAAQFPLEGLLGKRRWELPGLVPGSADWEGHRRVLDARQPYRNFEFSCVTADGTIRSFSVSGEPVFGEDGRFLGYRGVGTDVTERKREQRLLAMEHAVTRCLAEAEDVPGGLQAMIRVVCETKGWACGRYWQLDGASGVMRARESWSIADPAVENYLASTRSLEVSPGQGVMGEVLASGRMASVVDLASDRRAILPEAVKASGLHGACVVPVFSEGGILGVLAFISQVIHQPDQKLLEALNAVGAQLGQFLERKKAEQVLRESEQRYRSLTGLAADWYWETDADFRLNFVSRETRAVKAPSRSSVLGRRPWEIDYLNRGGPEWAAAEAAMRQHQVVREFEVTAQDARGFPRSILVSGHPVFDAEGRFSGYRGISRDVTERRRAEKLHELEYAVVRCLAGKEEAAPALDEVLAVICTSRNLAMGCYLEVDEAAGELRFVSAWCAPGDERVRQFLALAREGGFRPGEGAAGHVWQTGQPLWIADVLNDKRMKHAGPAAAAGLRSGFLQPVRSQGKVIGVLAFAGEGLREPDEMVLKTALAISSQLGHFLGRARSQQDLRRNEAYLQRFRAAMDASGDALMLIDRRRMRYTDVNKTLCELVGYTREEILGMAPWDLFNASREALEREYDALIATGGQAARSVRGEYRRKDGSRIPIETNRRALRTDEGWIIVGNARDISETIAHEHALKVGNERLERHARHQAIIAAFGQFALEHRGADELVQEAVRALAEYAGGALLLELNADNSVILRDGAGEGTAALIGNRTPLLPESATYQVLRTGVSACMDEAYLTSRPSGYAWSEWCRGMRSALFVPVRHDDKAAQRALALYSTRAQAFRDEDIQFAESIANLLSSVLQRAEAARRGEINRLRQERIARYGQFALKRREVGELVGEAVAMLGELADVAAFFEVQDRRSTVLRMAVGPGTDTSLGHQAAFRPNGAIGRVLAGGESVRVAQDYCLSVPEGRPWASWMRQMSSGVFVPVTHNGHAHGTLALFSRSAAAVSDEEMRYAEAIGHLLSTALQRERAEEELARQSRRQQQIAELGHRALLVTDVEGLFAECMSVALHEGADAAAIFEFDDKANRFSLRAARGIASDDLLGRLLETCGDCPVGTAFGAELPVLVRDHGAKPCRRVHGSWGGAMRSSLNVRIRGEKAPFGVLSVFSKAPDAFSEDDVKYLEAVANMVSSAIQRIQGVQRLAFMAQFDPLTSLANRSLLQDRLELTIAQSARKEWLAGVLFIDMDRFKLVNDTLGHHAGDQLIREVAERLRRCVRPGDTVGRISGDEFAVVLADLARPDDAALVAQKVLDALAAPFTLAASETFVTASIGIAVFPNDGTSADTLLRHADMAMYRAKKSSRNSYRFFTAKMNQRAMAKMQLDSDLRRATERREFLLHYQPKVELVGGALIGMEALLRWNHPQRGLVSPAEFIPALENSGLIIPVGEWVIEEAALQLRRWRDAGCIAAPVAINLSAKQFRRRDLDMLVQGTLKAAGLPASLLELEITESALADDPEDAVRQLRNLRAAGLKISVDDFGTGYSSLAYLTRLPLSSLKIDRSFVSKAMESSESASIVRAIIDMAHNLNFTVVAEGVETEAQARFLRLMKCEQAQGYLFGRPMSAEDMTRRLLRAP